MKVKLAKTKLPCILFIINLFFYMLLLLSPGFILVLVVLCAFVVYLFILCLFKNIYIQV